LSLLSIQNLSLSFVKDKIATPALHNISFTVNKGQVVALVGESGSGKSITSLSVLRLLQQPPAKYTGGKIIFNDEGNEVDVLTLNDHQLQQMRGNKISMIFQEPMSSLNPVLTCGAQVTEAILSHKKISYNAAKQQTIQLFTQVNLPNPQLLYNRYPHQVSGGQKQRVMIAMAISCHPQLLICDEPTTALDVTVQKNILLLLKNLQQQNNMGVLFITHDLGVVGEIADRVIVMYKGKIVEENTTANIFTNPQHTYTKALLACRPGLYNKGDKLPVVADFMDTDNSEFKIQHSKQHNHHLINNNQVALEVKNLNVWYPATSNFFGKTTSYTKAVNNVSFNVYRGETLGLVGESGCGKTSLGRAILQLIKPTGGQIIFNGIDLLQADKEQLKAMRRQMQIIFQDPYGSLNPRKTIGDAIAEPLLVHGISSDKKIIKDKVIALLEKVNLHVDFYKRYPHEFSGGQRQRIVIARALALQPHFVVCDESVSALDVSVQAQVLNLLNELKAEFGFTAIFISHDLSVVKYISDRIMVMNKGEIIETGKAADVYYNPKENYTKQLINAIPKPVFLAFSKTRFTLLQFAYSCATCI